MIASLDRLLKNLDRLTLLRGVVCAGLIGGILFSLELWFPINRSFPRAPILFAASEANVLLAEYSLSTILVVTLILTTVSKHPSLFCVLALVTLSLLVCFDQSRLQPWVYQYVLQLVVVALHDWRTKDDADSDRTISVLQLSVAAVYFWSGLQKLNFTFVHEIAPTLLAPLLNALPWLSPMTSGVGIFVALTEMLIGCGLLFSRSRDLFVWIAIAMHGIVLFLLITRDYNNVVWIWNCALMLVVLILFLRSNVYFMRGNTVQRSEGWKMKLARSVTLTAALLPLLSFWGWWDMYLSGALYSGNTLVGVVKINEDVRARLPQSAQAQLFRVESTGEEMLPLLEWAMADMNVPVYPEARVYKRVASEICRLTMDKKDIALIIKERPSTFSGKYEVTRIGCAQLER